MQGRVAGADGTGVDPRDIVEGDALFGFRATSGLTFWAGPSARAYTTGMPISAGFFWSGRASGRGTVLPDRMQTFVELWGPCPGALTIRNVGPAAAALRLVGDAARRASFWGRLAYRIESGHASNVRETVEPFLFSASTATRSNAA